MTNTDMDEETQGSNANEEDVPEAPVFMRDTPPAKGKMNTIKWGLMHDMTEEDLVNQGFNKKTVSMAAFELDKDNYRKRATKIRESKVADAKTNSTGTKSVTTYGSRSQLVPQKPFPPEFLISQIELPLAGNGAKTFETGMKFGASMLVLGVRVAQELGNMGLQQARPIMDMANAMRQGEAEAAKTSAAEAAMLAAEQVKSDMTPLIATLSKVSPSGDPMRDMVARVTEPILQRLMSMAIPGAGQQSGTPSGWTRKQVE